MTTTALMGTLAGLGAPTWMLWIIGAAALAAAAHVLYNKVYVPIRDTGRKLHKTYERVMDYDDRIANVERNTSQLTQNGGSHLADAVYRIEAGQTADRKVLADHIEWSQGEFMSVYKTLAARDVVAAAKEAGEKIGG